MTVFLGALLGGIMAGVIHSMMPGTGIKEMASWLSANWQYVAGAGYGLALLGTHIFPDNTVAYRVCKWLLAGAAPKA